ncbi:hypothetical protein ADUPG1_010933, partial [Aduncisulcus paluster]
TVSLDAGSKEATKSTLQYAQMAKTIKNTPEQNERMTKKLVIKNYVREIEALKLQVKAAQDKYGIYLTQEMYDSMQLKGEEHAEQARQIEELHAELAQKEKEFAILQELFHTHEEQLQTAKKELRDATEKLQITSHELGEEVLVRTENDTVVSKLQRQAQALIGQLKQKMLDVDGLVHRIEEGRKKEMILSESLTGKRDDILSETSEAKVKVESIVEHATTLTKSIATMSKAHRDIVDTQTNLIVRTIDDMRESSSTMLKQVSKCLSGSIAEKGHVEDYLDEVRRSTSKITANTMSLSYQAEAAAKAIKDMTSAVSCHLEKLVSSVLTSVDSLKSSFEECEVAVEKGVGEAHACTENGIRAAEKMRESVCSTLESAGSRSEAMLQNFKTRIIEMISSEVEDVLSTHTRTMGSSLKTCSAKVKESQESIGSSFEKCDVALGSIAGAVESCMANADPVVLSLRRNITDIGAAASELQSTESSEPIKAIEGFGVHTRDISAEIDNTFSKTSDALERVGKACDRASDAQDIVAAWNQRDEDTTKKIGVNIDHIRESTDFSTMQCASFHDSASKIVTTGKSLGKSICDIQSFSSTIDVSEQSFPITGDTPQVHKMDEYDDSLLHTPHQPRKKSALVNRFASKFGKTPSHVPDVFKSRGMNTEDMLKTPGPHLSRFSIDSEKDESEE